MSPFGAKAITVGLFKPCANCVLVKPDGTVVTAATALAARAGRLRAEFMMKGTATTATINNPVTNNESFDLNTFFTSIPPWLNNFIESLDNRTLSRIQKVLDKPGQLKHAQLDLEI